MSKKIIEPNFKDKVRPSWVTPVIDANGQIIDWKVNSPLLAQHILENNYMFAATASDGTSMIYLYDELDGTWRPIDISGIKRLIGAEFKDTDAKKVYDLISSQAINNTAGIISASLNSQSYQETFDNEQDLNIIPFLNNDYNIISEQLVPHSPDRYYLHTRNYDLSLNADAPITNKWLLESLGNDKILLQLMKIFIGESFYRSYKPIQNMIFIKGKGEDGKSVFLDYWEHLVGAELTSHLSLDQLTRKDTNFSLSELYGKDLNTYDDLNSSFIDSSMMGTVKQLTGGNRFDAEVKNKGNIRFANHATLVFATNEMPEIQNLGYAEKRRIFIFDWHRIENFEKKYRMSQIMEERGAFVTQCLREFSIILLEREQGKSQEEALPSSEVLEKNWKQYQLDSDPVARFIASRCNGDTNPNHNPAWFVEKDKLYKAFIDWAEQHQLKVKGMSDRKFNKKIRSLGYQEKYRRINGTMTRVWSKLMLLPNDAENDTDLVDEDLPELGF